MYFTAKEIAGTPDMPKNERNCLTKLNNLFNNSDINPELKRKRLGTKAFEYHFSLLPPAARAALLKRQGKLEFDGKLLNLPKPAQPRYDRDALWALWERAGAKAQETAKRKVEYVRAFYALVATGCAKMEAYAHICQEFSVAKATLIRDVLSVKGYDAADWLPQLLTKYQIGAMNSAESRRADIDEQAWACFKADYLRLEQPSFKGCYYRLKDAAKEKGWVVPSVKSLERRLKAEVPHEQQVLLRQGEHALMQLYPPQHRSVEDLDAMQWINGDGYQHNVFVRWHNGDIVRPKTWFWQDIRTRKILGWRTDISENTTTIRLSLMDVVREYGIPREITIDNTRAAANKWVTGGVGNRYRFKVKKDDPLGLIPMMGIKLHWSSVYFGKGHGQAKPVERSFGVGGLNEFVDKHPALAGAYTGENTNAKPDNYGSKAIPVEQFMQVLAEGIRHYNQREKRQTEVCRGVLSFDEAFNNSYATAVVRKPNIEQLRMLMLSAEAVRVDRHAQVSLDAGGSIKGRKNRYHCDALFQHIGKKVVVRFDPDNLHTSVVCYELNGLLIGEAECIDSTAFGDAEAAREFNRHRKGKVKAEKIAAKKQLQMDAIEAAELMRRTEPDTPTTPAPAASELVHLRQGNTVRKVTLDTDTEEQFDSETAFAAGVAQLMAAKKAREL
ncbi:transposase domain-containing protein [Shewanella sp. KCT]|uniref:transposase domain-containing protein n=1 Tax=Shewanella sp. KCT TaxID=2569535 RepID=UPI0011843364|nr:transposase domain-containing protein [Shewanella sp. KCT]TVP09815.1 DDE endonuclease [Shewanella sp. KCT]